MWNKKINWWTEGTWYRVNNLSQRSEDIDLKMVIYGFVCRLPSKTLKLLLKEQFEYIMNYHSNSNKRSSRKIKTRQIK